MRKLPGKLQRRCPGINENNIAILNQFRRTLCYSKLFSGVSHHAFGIRVLLDHLANRQGAAMCSPDEAARL